MPLSDNPTMKEIKRFYSITEPFGLKDLYRGGKYVEDIPGNAHVPKSGKITLKHLMRAKRTRLHATTKKVVETVEVHHPANEWVKVLAGYESDGLTPIFIDSIDEKDWTEQREVRYMDEQTIRITE